MTGAVAALAALAFAAGDPDPARRGVAYLAREVPRWAAENHCYSCHNNGDAARALLAVGTRRRVEFDPEALADTLAWLGRPGDWDDNGGDGPFSDRRLARLQFAATLADAVGTGRLRDRGPLEAAAARLAEDQQADGSWRIEGPDGPGAPATLGRALATWLAREALREADPGRHRDRIGAADRWLRDLGTTTTVDAAVRLLLPADGMPEDRDARGKALDRLLAGQAPDGGWGPYATSPPEPFDTAIALLGLARSDDPRARTAVARGRAYLADSQEADGSWPETTRPAGGESYALRVATTGWAVLALVATEGRDKP